VPDGAHSGNVTITKCSLRTRDGSNQKRVNSCPILVTSSPVSVPTKDSQVKLMISLNHINLAATFLISRCFVFKGEERASKIAKTILRLKYIKKIDDKKYETSL
jgi:hypothetical protein